MSLIEIKLGDCLSMIENGATIKQKEGAGGYPITRIETLSNDRFNRDRLGYADIYNIDLYKNHILDNEDLVMSHINSRSFLGRTVIYLKKGDETIIHGMNVLRIKTKRGILNPFYAYYYFKTPHFKKAIDNIRTDAINQSSINTNNIRDIKIHIPDLATQEKVVRVLQGFDKKIEENEKLNAELEAMAKQLYDYWFVQFDFPDENGKPYKSSGGKMVYNPTLKREIPAGWEITSIGDLITTERGISYSTPNISSGNGVPMLNLATFMPGGGDYKASGLKHYLGDYPTSKVLKPYDLIMCNTQQTAIKFETDIIGRAMLVPDIFEGDIVFSHHVNIIKTKNDDLKYYLLYLFNSDYYHKYISGYTNGTNILGLSFNGVSEYNLEIPPDAILKQFASLILDIAKKKSLIFKESSNLTHLRDSLLPMLMNGQVTVE